MSAATIGLLGFLAMFALMALGMPIAFCMALVGALGVAFVLGADPALHLLASGLWGEFSSYGLAVIPMFVFMGQIAYRSGVTERLYHAAYTWCGRLPGGIASTTVLASAGFACISGSNSATAATMGTVAMPEMRKYKYDGALATGSIAIGGTLGVIIPPSVVLIIIAIQTEQSVLQLFLASLVPGLILTAMFVLTILYLCRRNPALGPPGRATSLGEKLRSLAGVIEALILFMVVIGGLYLGWFTPTEAGAAGAFGALLIALFQRKLSWRNAVTCVSETLRISAMVVLLVTAAVIFARFLAITRLPFELAEWVAALAVPPWVVLAMVLLIYVVGGMLMDALGFLVVTLPIFFPLAAALNFDPIWFTVLLTLVTSLSAVTPPVGVNVFVVSAFAPEVPISTIFRGVLVFIVAYLICIAAIMAFPQIVLALPASAM